MERPPPFTPGGGGTICPPIPQRDDREVPVQRAAGSFSDVAITPPEHPTDDSEDTAMRPEIEKSIDDIKESLALLRRHL